MDLPTLIDVLAEFGVTGSPAVVRFAPIAAAVQQQRLDSGASGTSRTTRSTALWTLLNLDPDLADVLGRAGLSAKALGELLSVSTLPTAEFTGPAILHDDFAEGLRSYLRRHKSSGPFTPTDLAASILQSASNLDVGLLPSRLSQLSVDPADLLDRLGSTAGGESRPRLDAVRVAEVDPFDFGVTTGADGPRGRRLNPYLERPTDKDVEHHLRDDHAVLVQATRGSGAPGPSTRSSTGLPRTPCWSSPPGRGSRPQRPARLLFPVAVCVVDSRT